MKYKKQFLFYLHTIKLTAMKKFFKIASRILLVLLIIVIGIVGYIKIALPNVGDAPDMKVEATAERIARGSYLANNVTVCIDCHSTRDWGKFSGPIVPGTFGKGGELFGQKFGFPGAFYSKNITPEGISRYSDGELFRLITTGVTKEGKAIFPVMPYHNYGRMDEEDIKSIIAYIRTLKPIKNNVPASSPDFPMNIIINTIPQKASLTKRPDKSDAANYGGYLAMAASCVDCHTPFEKGEFAKGMEYGGGREFPFPDGAVVRSSNISPDVTGLGAWTEEMFLERFRTNTDSATMSRSIKPGEYNTIMPWTMYARMDEGGLKAIFAYLKTVKPISNKVVKYSPAGK